MIIKARDPNHIVAKEGDTTATYFRSTKQVHVLATNIDECYAVTRELRD